MSNTSAADRAAVAEAMGMKPREIADVKRGPNSTAVVTTFEGAQTVLAQGDDGRIAAVPVGERTGPDTGAVFAEATHAREQRAAATEAELEEAQRLAAAEEARVEAERLAAEAEAERLAKEEEAKARAEAAAAEEAAKAEAEKAEHATEPATATDAPRARGRQGR